MLAAEQFGQIAPLLRVRPIAADLIDAEIGMGAVREANRGRGPADLLHGEAMGEIAKARAAIILLDGDPVQAERAHVGPKILRETVGPVDLRRAGREIFGGEGANHVAQHVEIRPKREIETGILHHDASSGVRAACRLAMRLRDVKLLLPMWRRRLALARLNRESLRRRALPCDRAQAGCPPNEVNRPRSPDHVAPIHRRRALPRACPMPFRDASGWRNARRARSGLETVGLHHA